MHGQVTLRILALSASMLKGTIMIEDVDSSLVHRSRFPRIIPAIVGLLAQILNFRNQETLKTQVLISFHFMYCIHLHIYIHTLIVCTVYKYNYNNTVIYKYIKNEKHLFKFIQ